MGVEAIFQFLGSRVDDFFQRLCELPTRAPDFRALFSLFCLGSRLLTQEIEFLSLPLQGPWGVCVALRVEFLLKTDSEYPKDVEFTLFTLANPGSSLRFNTHWSPPPISGLCRCGGPRKMSQAPVSRNSNIERRMDRPKAVVGFIRGLA